MNTREASLHRELYFQTPVFYQDTDSHGPLHQELKQYVYQCRESDQQGLVRSNVKKVGAWHSQVNLHQAEECQAVVRYILAHAEELFEHLGYDPAYEPAIDTLWANVSPKYAYNRAHTHPNSLWSGVYYLQVPDNAGRIFFLDPRTQSQAFTPRYHPEKKRDSLGWSEVYFEPQEGRLLMFPSWLLHEVEPNMTEVTGEQGNRISLSFNIYQRKRQGGKVLSRCGGAGLSQGF